MDKQENNKLHYEDCGWWKLITEKSSSLNSVAKGRCHSRAPIGIPIVMPKLNKITNTVSPQVVEYTIWPVTFANCEVCGDFKPIVEPVKVPLKIGQSNGQG